MKVSFKTGPNFACFANLKPGDIFIAADQACEPVEKREVYMKLFSPELKRSSAVRLEDGVVFAIAPGLPIIKGDAELSVIL